MAINFREMAVQVQRNAGLERALRAAHARLLKVGDADCPEHFAQFVGWIKENSPDGPFESRDAGVSVRRAKKSQSLVFLSNC